MESNVYKGMSLNKELRATLLTYKPNMSGYRQAKAGKMGNVKESGIYGYRHLIAGGHQAKCLFMVLVISAALLTLVISAALLTPGYCRVIASSTLRLKLTVPSPPVTMETPEGSYYGNCIVEKGDGVIIVASL